MTYELAGLGLDLSAQNVGKEVANYLDPMLRTVLAQEGPKLIAQVQPMIVAQVPAFAQQVRPVIEAQIPPLLDSLVGRVQQAAPVLADKLRPTIQLEISKLSPLLQAELVKLRPTLEAELGKAIAGAGVDKLKREAVLALAVHAGVILLGVFTITAVMNRK